MFSLTDECKCNAAYLKLILLTKCCCFLRLKYCNNKEMNTTPRFFTIKITYPTQVFDGKMEYFTFPKSQQVNALVTHLTATHGCNYKVQNPVLILINCRTELTIPKVLAGIIRLVWQVRHGKHFTKRPVKLTLYIQEREHFIHMDFAIAGEI